METILLNEESKEKKVKEIKGCISQEDSLYCIPSKEAKGFEPTLQLQPL